MTAHSTHSLVVSGPERLPYGQALEAQLALRERCLVSDGRENFLMMVEHPPVITVGRSGDEGDVLADAGMLRERGVEVVHTGRGGKVTFHGPGQLVVYPIIDLSRRGRDLHRYLRDLEGWLIAVCESCGVDAGARKGRTGVWVGECKIAAIGVAARRWVSFHGVALNVTIDLSWFDLIVPCGFTDRGVTSLARELEEPPRLEDVAGRAAELFAEHFDFQRMSRRPCVLRTKQKTG